MHSFIRSGLGSIATSAFTLLACNISAWGTSVEIETTNLAAVNLQPGEQPLMPSLAPDVSRRDRRISFISSPQFSDTPGYWASACIEGMAWTKRVSGYGDGSFRPNGTMTRAEFAAVMMKAFPQVPKVRPAPSFTDVADDYWAREVISQAYQRAFLSGYPGNIFRPTQPITRVQALTILANTQGLASVDANLNLLNYFDDQGEIPNYAKGAISAATQFNLVVNHPTVTQLRPNANATRGEATAFLCQGLAQSETANFDPRFSVPLRYVAQADAVAGITVSDSLKTKLIEAMRQKVGGTVADYRIASAAPARWRSCETLPCKAGDQPQDFDGLRIKVAGQGETWTYYSAKAGASQRDIIQLDGPASVSSQVRAALAQQAKVSSGGDFQILAAKPVNDQQDCQGDWFCGQVTRSPHWQILATSPQQPFHRISFQGQAFDGDSLEQQALANFLPETRSGLPQGYIEAALQDIQRRQLGQVASDFQVEPIAVFTWNDCDGGEASPSQPARGTCQDVERSGWRMVTRNGTMRWVHYFVQPLPSLEQAVAFIRPDGLQSVPQSVKEAVVAAATQYDSDNRISEGSSPNQYRLQWASAQFFDACLKASPARPRGALICSSRVQPGWRLELVGSQVNAGGGQSRLVYHSNLDGSELQLVSLGQWFPPP